MCCGSHIQQQWRMHQFFGHFRRCQQNDSGKVQEGCHSADKSWKRNILGTWLYDKKGCTLMKSKLKMMLSYASGDIYGGGSFMVFSLLFMNYLVLVEGIP